MKQYLQRKTLQFGHVKVSVSQRDPSPAWVDFEIEEGERMHRFCLYPEDMRLMISFLESLKKMIVTEKQDDRRRRRESKALRKM